MQSGSKGESDIVLRVVNAAMSWICPGDMAVALLWPGHGRDMGAQRPGWPRQADGSVMVLS